MIISKMLLSSPGAEAHPSTHADTQSLVFFPEEMERAAERAALCAHGHLVPGGGPSALQTFHPQGALAHLSGAKESSYCDCP